MGIEIGAFIEAARLPRRELWQAAIDALDLPVQLPESFDPTVDLGAQQFTLSGEEAWPEVGYIDASDRSGWAEVLHELGRSRRRRLGGRDAFVVFRWSTELDAAAAADAAVAALAVVADALVWDLEADELFDAKRAVTEARGMVDAALRERDADQPLQKREADRLWRSHLVPALEDATGGPVASHGWDLVVGTPGWFAHLLVLDRSSGTDRRAVKATALVPQLYGIISPRAMTPVRLEVSEALGYPGVLVSIPADPGPLQDAALAELTRRIIEEALPHFARFAALDALIAANEHALTVGTSIPQYTLDALAGGYAIRGDVDRAVTTYEILVEHLDAQAAKEGKAPDQLHDWEVRLRQRAIDVAALLPVDRGAALARLADQAQANAAEIGAAPLDLSFD